MAKKSIKVGRVVGALAAAMGVVAVGAIVASGTAVGTLVESFKAAGSAVKKVINEYKDEERLESEEPVAGVIETESVEQEVEA